MHGFARHAQNALGGPLNVFADHCTGAQNFDHAENPAYSIERFGGVKPLRRRAKARKIMQAVKSGTVKAVFTDSWKSVEFLKPDINVPVICFAHGNEFPQVASDVTRADKLPPSRRRKEARISKAFKTVSQVIPVSHATRERIVKYIPDTASIHVIHPPIEALPEMGVDARKVAVDLWPASGVRLLCLSRLIAWKGVDMSLKTLTHLRDQNIKAQLIIAGDGPQLSELKQLARNLGLSENVAFTGRIEGAEKYALMQSADIFMQPGRKIGDQCEGFGITYLEAGLAGLPSISGNVGGAVDAVEHGVTGLCVDGSNLTSIQEATISLIKDMDLRKRLSKAAKQRAEQSLWSQKIYEITRLIDEGIING